MTTRATLLYLILGAMTACKPPAAQKVVAPQATQQGQTTRPDDDLFGNEPGKAPAKDDEDDADDKRSTKDKDDNKNEDDGDDTSTDDDDSDENNLLKQLLKVQAEGDKQLQQARQTALISNAVTSLPGLVTGLSQGNPGAAVGMFANLAELGAPGGGALVGSLYNFTSVLGALGAQRGY